MVWEYHISWTFWALFSFFSIHGHSETLCDEKEHSLLYQLGRLLGLVSENVSAQTRSRSEEALGTPPALPALSLAKHGSSRSLRTGTWSQDRRGTLGNLQNARNPQAGLTGSNGLRLLCGGPHFRVLFASLLLLAGSPALTLITTIYGNQVFRDSSSISLDYAWPS